MAKATIAIIVISIAFTLAPSTASAEDICTVEILDGQLVNRCVSRAQWDRERAIERQAEIARERRRRAHEEQAAERFRRFREQQRQLMEQRQVEFEERFQSHPDYEQLADFVARFCVEQERYPLNNELASWERLQQIAREVNFTDSQPADAWPALAAVCINAVRDNFPAGASNYDIGRTLSGATTQARQQREAEREARLQQSRERHNQQIEARRRERQAAQEAARIERNNWARIRSVGACRNIERRVGQSSSAALHQSSRACQRAFERRFGR